jgi:uncharacterized protein (TIRG00374 family)
LKDRILTIAKAVITVALIVYIFSKVDLVAVGNQLLSANLWLVLLALLLFMGAILINGFKWFVLLRAQQVTVPFSAVAQYMFVGFFFNNVLPANIGGDVMRGYEMARYTDRTAQAAVSVVVDRIIGLIAYMTAAAVMSIIVVALLGYTQLRLLLVLAAVALLGVAGTLAILLSRRLRRLVGRVFQWRGLAPLAPVYEGVSQAFDAYRFQYRALIWAFLIALAGLTATSFVNWLLFEALGGGVNLTYIFLFNPLIALVLLVPISIGGHGVIQNAYPFFYGLVGVSEEQAVAVSVLMSFVIIVGSLPGGVLWLRNRRAMKEQTTSVTVGQPTG